MKKLQHSITTILLLVLALGFLRTRSPAADRPPNVVIMFADDQGYGDLGCFPVTASGTEEEPSRGNAGQTRVRDARGGAEGYDTPHLDRMAAEGARLTDFYVSSPVCSASRSALLTGCYHSRISINGALGPSSPIGLGHDEITIAELLKQKDYATAIYGKWHLGRPESMLPTNHGFDEYFGLPYSNDMWPFHPGVLHLPMEERLQSGLELYDLGKDIGETNNLADQHPEVVTRLQKMADAMRNELGDGLKKKKGTGNRPPESL